MWAISGLKAYTKYFGVTNNNSSWLFVSTNKKEENKMDYAVFVAKEEKNLYDSLKKGMPYVLKESQKEEVEILSILEKLGYPMSHLGL